MHWRYRCLSEVSYFETKNGCTFHPSFPPQKGVANQPQPTLAHLPAIIYPTIYDTSSLHAWLRSLPQAHFILWNGENKNRSKSGVFVRTAGVRENRRKTSDRYSMGEGRVEVKNEVSRKAILNHYFIEYKLNSTSEWAIKRVWVDLVRHLDVFLEWQYELVVLVMARNAHEKVGLWELKALLDIMNGMRIGKMMNVERFEWKRMKMREKREKPRICECAICELRVPNARILA